MTGATDQRETPPDGLLPIEQTDVLSMRISNLDFAGVCAQVSARIASGEPGYIVTPNVDHVCRYHKDAAFRAAYDNAFLVLADGMPLLWAAALFGKPLREKLSGSDLLPLLSAYAAERGYSIYLLGAAPGVADEAARLLQQTNPGLRVAGAYSPPLRFEDDPATLQDVLKRLRDAAPDICFLALGSPRQEIWLHRHHRESGARVLLGVGAALDFAAGRVRRAPVWMQRSGLEWTWRVMQEPMRLGRRYFVDDSYFVALLAREALCRLGLCRAPTTPAR